MPVAPDPNALRRDRRDDQPWTRLTPRAADAVVPDFPLDSPTSRDLHWWAESWSTPMANQWEANGEHLAVALFCRLMARAEAPDSPVTLMRPLQQLREELGLSVTGLRRRRWLLPGEKASASTPSTTAARTRPPTFRQSARERFRVVSPAGDPPADPHHSDQKDNPA